ncbi:MAG TPA: hypothetical protein VFT49_02370 [Candidatus Saccharimonadales bacterium]|nr:hypothetical protein [Candidatus Saccharimonadales bacterium]
MLQLPAKIKPTRGFSHVLHIALNGLLPVLAYILVKIEFVPLAILLVVLAKWRMFAVRPRYWLANIVANGVDIIVSVSFILFMASTSVTWWQLLWVVLYAGWLVYLKPRYDVLSVSAQAMIGQLLGLTVLYLKFGDASLIWLILATWAVTYLAARHYLTSFEEPYSALLAHIWGYFGACVAFILGHWLLFYGSIAQIIIIMTTIGYGLAALYYIDANGRLNKVLERQLLGIMFAILLIVLVLSDWTGATV